MGAGTDVVGPDIVFVGGAPGVGKTSVARPLAARLGMDVTHVDDFHMVLERMTDAERYPAIHEWRLHPERVLALDDAGSGRPSARRDPRCMNATASTRRQRP